MSVVQVVAVASREPLERGVFAGLLSHAEAFQDRSLIARLVDVDEFPLPVAMKLDTEEVLLELPKVLHLIFLV